MSFPARFPGRCAAECGTSIRVGDEIAYDEDDQIVHVGCLGRITVERPVTVCPLCFLTSCDHD